MVWWWYNNFPFRNDEENRSTDQDDWQPDDKSFLLQIRCRNAKVEFPEHYVATSLKGHCTATSKSSLGSKLVPGKITYACIYYPMHTWVCNCEHLPCPLLSAAWGLRYEANRDYSWWPRALHMRKSRNQSLLSVKFTKFDAAKLVAKFGKTHFMPTTSAWYLD